MVLKTLFLSLLFILFTNANLISQYDSEDWAERDTWMEVGKIFEMAEIEEGMRVADVGCHEGYLTFHLSRKVAATGKVYAVDVEAYRLDNLREHLEARKVNNVEVILSDYDDPKLPSGTLDAVIVMDTYHEIAEYMKVLEHIKHALKPHGRLLLLEKLKTHKKGKPREEQVNAHTISSKYVKEELEDAGFTISKEVKDFGYWQEDEEKQMWILVALKKHD